MFVLLERRHYASLKEAFIITLTKLATGDSNVVLADCFGFSGDGMVSLIYRFTIDVLDNKARGLLYGDAGCLQHWLHLSPDFDKLLKIT